MHTRIMQCNLCLQYVYTYVCIHTYYIRIIDVLSLIKARNVDVLVVMVVMEYQVLLVLQGEMVEMAKWGNLVPWVPLDRRDPLALSMEDWSTLAGGGPPALPPQELNWCTVEELLAVTTITKEVDQTFCVCQMILSTVTMLLEYREPALCME